MLCAIIRAKDCLIEMFTQFGTFTRQGVVVLRSNVLKVQAVGESCWSKQSGVPVKSSPSNRSLTLYIGPNSRADTNSGPGVHRHFALQGLRKHVGGVSGRMRLPSLEVTNLSICILHIRMRRRRRCTPSNFHMSRGSRALSMAKRTLPAVKIKQHADGWAAEPAVETPARSSLSPVHLHVD
jgi:hypothetical protein